MRHGARTVGGLAQCSVTAANATVTVTVQCSTVKYSSSRQEPICYLGNTHSLAVVVTIVTHREVCYCDRAEMATRTTTQRHGKNKLGQGGSFHVTVMAARGKAVSDREVLGCCRLSQHQHAYRFICLLMSRGLRPHRLKWIRAKARRQSPSNKHALLTFFNDTSTICNHSRRHFRGRVSTGVESEQYLRRILWPPHWGGASNLLHPVEREAVILMMD